MATGRGLHTAAGRQVFISYSRAASGEHARALDQALSNTGIAAYLDTRDGNAGESIAEQVLEALLGSRVAVVFADAAYFTSRICAEELTVVLAAYRELCGRDAPAWSLDEAIQSIVVALPPSGHGLTDLELLPPEVRSKDWPQGAETAKLVTLVRRHLERAPRTIGARLEDLDVLSSLRQRLHETIPGPKQFGAVPVYHDVEFLPSLGEGFVGRSRELWDLHSKLAVRQGGAAAPTVALEGGGGFGKTRLAVEYLHRYGPQEYPGGLFWVNAGVPEDRLEVQHHGILRRLQPSIPDLRAFKESGRDVGRELAAALQEVAGTRRVLYVVDNVPEPMGDRPPEPVRRWCPAPAHVSLILTSRAMQTLAGGMRRLEVRELSTDSAMTLLVHAYVDGAGIPEDDRRTVVTWVGEWPLALELLNSSLRVGALSPEELLSAARTAQPTAELDHQMRALSGVVPDGTLRGVAEALTLSYERLADEARSAARQLAWLGPEPIPMALVARLASGVRAQLRYRSFVREIRSGDVAMFGRMHRVMADYLRGETGDRDREVQAACETLLDVMTWDACADPALWPLMNACRAHAEAVLEREAGRPASLESIERQVNLGRHLARLLRKQGRLAAAEQLLQTWAERARRLLGEENPTTLNTLGNLAWTLRTKGDPERAAELQQHVLAVRLRLLAPADPATLAAMRNLALTLADQGHLDRARELQERVWEEVRSTVGEEHPEWLMSIADLAATLRRRGESERARAFEAQVPEAWWMSLDSPQLDAVAAMERLAATIREAGEHRRARELCEQVLVARRRLQGEEHPDALRTTAELAATLRDEGLREQARELMVKVHESRRRVLGEEHPATRQAADEVGALSRTSHETAGE